MFGSNLLQAIWLFFHQALAKIFQPKWKSYIYAILPHPHEAKVLMLSEDGSYFLPHIRVNDSIDFEHLITIKSQIEPKLKFSVNILYYADLDYNKSQRQIHCIYVIERDAAFAEFTEGDWIDLQVLRNLPLKFPEHKSVLETYLLEIESGNIPELRPPWAREGWLQSATQWIDEQLLELKYQRLSPVECIKSWGISCVLRVNTNGGKIYLKEASTLPLFCNEPVVTPELANLFSPHIPHVLSVDTQRHWMLLADFGEPIGRNAPVKLQKDIYRLLAQIQIKSVQYIDKLLSVGCLPMSRLLEAWTLAKPLCALHHAVSYQHIVACLEPRQNKS